MTIYISKLDWERVEDTIIFFVETLILIIIIRPPAGLNFVRMRSQNTCVMLRLSEVVSNPLKIF